MTNPREYEIETREVKGRSVIIMRLVWPDGDIGYDVYEAVNGKLTACLTDEESLDAIPTDEEIAALLPQTGALDEACAEFEGDGDYCIRCGWHNEGHGDMPCCADWCGLHVDHDGPCRER